MKHEYIIKGIRGKKGTQWKIIEQSNGKFLCDVAFWFPTRQSAETRLAEIVIEDTNTCFSTP